MSITREKFIAMVKLQLDELNDKIEALETGARVARREAEERHQQELAKLRHQYKLVVAKLNAPTAASADAYNGTSDAPQRQKADGAFTHPAERVATQAR